jgi:hypothetical protein
VERDLASYERRFRRAGLPLLIEDWNAGEDAFARAAGLLALAFVLELLGAVNLEWSLAANVGAAAGGLALLLGAAAVVNVARGRRLLARPQRIGVPELVLFVLVPALLPLIFGGQVTSALVTAGGNLVLLALVYAVFGYGLVWIVRWGARRLTAGLTGSLASLTRAVPLLLVFALVLFVNTEMWEVFSGLSFGLLAVLGVLLALLAAGFLAARLPREVERLVAEAGGGDAPLRRRQLVNVALVLLVSQALQVLVVCAGVAAFFVVFGALAIGPEVRESWTGSTGTAVSPTVALFGQDVTVTTELLRVSAAIAGFAGLYYVIAVQTEATYREEFLEDVVGELRDTFRLRGEYLRLRA